MSFLDRDDRRSWLTILPLFVLATAFVSGGLWLRLAGDLDRLAAEEERRLEDLGERCRHQLVDLLDAPATTGTLIRLDAGSRPLGVELYPSWQPDDRPARPLPLAGESALALEARGEHERALRFLGHDSLAGLTEPRLLLARARCLIATGQVAAAIAALEVAAGDQDATIDGLPFALPRALLLCRLDQALGQGALIELCDQALAGDRPLPLEVASSLETSSAAMASERVALWLLGARALDLLRREPPDLGDDEVLIGPDFLLFRRGDRLGIAAAALADEALGRLRELAEPGVEIGFLDRAAATTGPIRPLVLEIAIPRRSEDRERLAYGLLAAGAAAALLGILVALALIGRERKLARLKSDFIDVVSHELRTPLAVLSLKSEMLAGGDVPAAKREAYIQDLDHEVGRLRELVDDLLDFARLEKGRIALRRDEVELRALLGRLLRRNRYRHRALDQLVRLSVPRRPLVVDGDGEALERSLANLLDNAAKYAGRGRSIEIAVAESASALTIAVSDDGPGVPEEIRPRLFERFVRGRHDQIAGSGLGLALVRATIEAHGGRVRHERPARGGARFVLELPRSASR
ncbi:MAG: HAMP domain-containing histidine kinase [Planctomycetes bacterium]|nr:HAMP domain-containing histidine kinase [Planctomycetota bacterium]